MSHWNYKNKSVDTIPDNSVAFVYIITNKINNRKYIGKKNFYSTTMLKPLKGKTRRRKKVKESNWRNYTGSCKELNEDIKKFGKENFTFEILEFNTSKAENNYSELRYQIFYNVLDKVDEDGNREFYNQNIALRYYPSEKFRNERNFLYSKYVIDY